MVAYFLMPGVKGAPEATQREGPTCNHSGEESKLRTMGVLMWEVTRRGDDKQDATGEKEIKQ